jgi:hypothetical protein
MGQVGWHAAKIADGFPVIAVTQIMVRGNICSKAFLREYTPHLARKPSQRDSTSKNGRSNTCPERRAYD